MSFSPLKADVIAATAVGILERLVLLPALVDRIGGDQFKNVRNDTITRRIPARTKARKKDLRATGAGRVIQTDDLAESSISITLTDHIYHATDMTDENLTLDITDFGSQILAAQVRAVVEDLEFEVYDVITGATYVPGLNTATWGPSADGVAWSTFTRARRILNAAHVRPQGRIMLVGLEAEERLLNDKNLKPGPNPTGWGNETLQSAAMGMVAGFTIVPCTLLADNEAYAFVSDAFSLATLAPAIPDSVKFGKTAGSDGFGLRWLRDYDSNILSDRSIVDCYSGTASVEDGKVPAGVSGVDYGAHAIGSAYNARAVKITLT